MNNDRTPVNARLFFGIAVLLLGVAWTLDNLHMIDASEYLRWWPAVALAWGLLLIAGVGIRRQTVPGMFWVLLGGVTLLNTLDLFHFTIFDLWPLFLIVIGGSIVARAWGVRPSQTAGDEPGSTFTVFVMMGGAERKVVSQAFQRGDVSAVMGGATIDFRSALPANGRAEIDVFALWGGVELIVPVGWRVVGEVSPILGGFEDTTVPAVDSSSPILVVKGTAVMGGVEVKHDRGRRDEVVTIDVAKRLLDQRKNRESQAGEQS